MRNYIRHPSDIPIEVVPVKWQAQQKTPKLQNYSQGGISCLSEIPQLLETVVKIRIPFIKPPFETTGIVKWCQRKNRHYEIGIEFLDQTDEFKIRMVEQICHIEHYKNEVLLTQGRKLSGHEAAMEWIEKYADRFPASDDDKAVNH